MPAGRIPAILVLCALLGASGCAPLTAAGAALGAVGTAVSVADQLASAANPLIRKACDKYAKARAAGEAMAINGLLPESAAAKLKRIEAFGDAACADPPQGNALSTAIWLGELAAKLKTLTGPGAPAGGPNG